MRVLWFAPIPFPEVRERMQLGAGGKGGWLLALKDALTQIPDLELGIAWASRSVKAGTSFQEGGVGYYNIPVSRLGYYTQSFKNELVTCAEVVQDFGADVVHVHGTESFYGLLSEYVQVPLIVSLQGIITECSKNYFGRVPIRDLLVQPRLLRSFLDMKWRSRTEKRILQSARFFMGRTLWDQSHVSRWNPSAKYFQAPELLRKEFAATKWRPESIQSRTIYCTSSASPYKGVDCLIEALHVLRSWLPDARLRVGGISQDSDFGRYLWRIVKRYHLQDAVQFMGYLSASDIAQELLQAHAYVMPSFIENSSNSLCEAMLVGVPCVAAAVGGTLSLIRDEETGLLFPRGEAAVLAMQLKRILTDNALAQQLSAKAIEVARKRHDRQGVVDTYLSIYHHVIESS